MKSSAYLGYLVLKSLLDFVVIKVTVKSNHNRSNLYAETTIFDMENKLHKVMMKSWCNH